MSASLAEIIDQIEAETLEKVEALTQHENLTPHQKYNKLVQHVVMSLINRLRHQILDGLGGNIQVLSGPFTGMRYHEKGIEGAYIPKLLGSYESELHPTIEQIVQTPYRQVINIGCADGFYAVGFARLMTNTLIQAYDINPKAREATEALARMNGVTEHVAIGEEVTPEVLQALLVSGDKSLVFCDIEGAEFELLDPNKTPALAAADLVVETHHHMLKQPQKLDELVKAFEATHTLKLITHGSRNANVFPWLAELSQLEQFIAMYEYRPCPTPWLIMQSRQA